VTSDRASSKSPILSSKAMSSASAKMSAGKFFRSYRDPGW
jgi:hypothetical protein